MKTKKIRIAVVEDSSYYNHIIQNQINDLCHSKQTPGLKFDIISLSNVDELLANEKNLFQVIVFDNHFKNNKQQPDYNVSEIMDEVRSTNKDCFFISISGYREMVISAYLYRENELLFSYSKQSAVKNESHEEKCSIPALHKLLDKFLHLFFQESSILSTQLIAA